MKIISKNKNGYIAELSSEEIYKIIAEGLEYNIGSRAPIANDVIQLNHIFERLTKEKAERGFLEKTNKELEALKNEIANNKTSVKEPKQVKTQ